MKSALIIFLMFNVRLVYSYADPGVYEVEEKESDEVLWS